MATFFSQQYGMPPITGRVLGWLMVCDPPQQSGAEVAEAIGASRASITTNVRLLTAAGLVRRLTRRGERTAYYILEDDAWEALVRGRLRSADEFQEITRDGIKMLGPGAERARRVQVAHDVYQWLIDLVAEAPPIPSTRQRPT
jgi:DNA-binding transcriptional regulator GbsR (MarR family)